MSKLFHFPNNDVRPKIGDVCMAWSGTKAAITDFTDETTLLCGNDPRGELGEVRENTD